MPTFKNIMIAVDPEDNNHKHLEAGLWVASQTKSHVTVLTVVDEREMNAPEGWEDKEHYDRHRLRYREWVETKIKQLVDDLNLGGLDVKLLIRSGVPYHEIIAAATENDVDLIVLRTHGRTGLEKFFIGSVASKVVQHAPCSVYVVR